MEQISGVDVYLTSLRHGAVRVFFLGCLVLSDKHDDLTPSKVLL